MTHIQTGQLDRHEDHVVVPLRRKVAYGMGAFSEGMMNDLLVGWVLIYYNTILMVDQVLIGWALFFPRLWEAFTDPFMGNITDNFRSRWGRRRPFILVGGPLCCLMFFLIWAAPADFTERAKFVYLLMLSVGYYTALTVASIPYSALGAELSIDYHERTRVYSVRAIMASVGSVLIIPFWQLIQDRDLFSTPIAGVRTMGFVYAVLACAGYIIVFRGTREEGELQERPKLSLIPAFRHTLSNGPFWVVTGTTLLLIVGVYSAFPFGNYLNLFYVFHGDQEAAGPLITVNGIVMQSVAFLGFAFAQWLGVRVGKKHALMICFGIVTLAPVTSWWLYTPENPWLQLLFTALVIWGIPGVLVFPSAMIADLVDIDELKTGRRREGVYMAMNAFIFKLGFSGTTLWTSYCLKWVGFNPELTQQAPSTILNLRLILAILPVVFLGLATFLLYFYRVDEKRVRAVRAELEQRRLPGGVD